jgi:circadian clock protein KaiC
MAELQDGMGARAQLVGIEKARTGIDGFDQITGGGLPAGRPTLVCGGPGCGKTLFAMQFLVAGATRFGEPGVFMSFEESSEELAKNVASLGFDLDDLMERGLIAMDTVVVERSEIEETGDYDLEGLFVRLELAIRSVGAKRVVLDTIESLFSGLSNQAILRAELRRLFRFLKEKGVAVVITGERGEGQLTRQGLEEYVSDCVILLDHRVDEQISTRRLRVVKYRGSAHGTNEYPFIIDEQGITVMPLTSTGLAHGASTERMPTGIPDLDQMLEGKGYFKGSSILVSGMAGSGKSTVAAHFAEATCAAGHRCIYFAMEESQQQIIRNMRSVGIDLQKWVDKKLLRFSARRPTLFGLETHLATMYRDVTDFEPAAVVIDPMSALLGAGATGDVHSMVLRLVDFLKARGVTALFTNLGVSSENVTTEIQISSLMDVWLLLYNRESNGEHNRQLYLLKSRGMAHSNEVREFILSSEGIKLRAAYVGPEGVLTGSARLAREAKDNAATLARAQDMERRSRELERKRRETAAQIEILQAQLASEEAEVDLLNREGSAREDQLAADRVAMGMSRHTGATPNKPGPKPTRKPKK